MANSAFRLTPRAQAIRRKILVLIESKPMSTQDIAGRIHLSARGAFSYIKTLREDKLVHCAGFDNSPKGSRRPLWKKGNLPDAQMIAKRAGKRHLRRAAHEADVFRLLMERPRTAQQLAPLVGLCRARMCILMKKMRGHGIYVSDYVYQDQNYFPVYSVGPGPDADRAQAVERTRARRRAIAKSAAPWFASLYAPPPTAWCAS